MYQLERPAVVTVSRFDDADQLERIVQARLSGRIRHLRLLLVDDGIVLRGLARTYHAKQLAQHAVMQHTDLPIVANEIEVA